MTSADTLYRLVQCFCVPGLVYVAIWYWFVSRRQTDSKQRRHVHIWLGISILFGLAGAVGIFLPIGKSAAMRLLLAQLMPLLIATLLDNDLNRASQTSDASHEDVDSS